MDKENGLPKRKPTRLNGFDYSTHGAYFVTICAENRARIFSDVIGSVGDGALDVPQIRLTRIGRIAEKYLLSSENISGVKIDQYVIMPDHIHVIIFLSPDAYAKRESGSSRAPVNGMSRAPVNGMSRAPSPTVNAMLPRVISAFKRLCNKELGTNVFQRSYADHIVRDKEDYETRKRYILENPMRWYYNEIHKKDEDFVRCADVISNRETDDQSNHK